MSKPEISIADNTGFHNSNPDTAKRLGTYKDLSTVCIVPCLDSIHWKIVQNWMGMMSPMNQKFARIFVSNMEVGHAYSQTIEMILANPELSKWKYILTMEHDNVVPPDGLLKLYEGMDKYDAIGGLYFTKGEGGQPMCYGDPKAVPFNFIPFMPPAESVTQCRGIGMGFSLFKMSLFKDPKMPRPFFETVQRYEPGKGAQGYTQDLRFCENAGRLGYKIACDSRVKVGHMDTSNGFIW